MASTTSHMKFDFKGKSHDLILEAHLQKLTAYEHQFDEHDDTPCGVLFNIAVHQFEEHLASKPEFAHFNAHKHEIIEFDEEKCRHVSTSYTWIKLVFESERRECEIHVPLNLLEYVDKEEGSNIVNEKYAELAIMKGDTKCRHIHHADDSTKASDSETELTEEETNKLYEDDSFESYDSDEDDEDYANLPPLKLERRNAMSPAEIIAANPHKYGIRHADGTREYLYHIKNASGEPEGYDVCSMNDKLRFIELFYTQANAGKVESIVLTTENISECYISKELGDNMQVSSSDFKAIVNINTTFCYHGITNNVIDGTVEDLREPRTALESCTTTYAA